MNHFHFHFSYILCCSFILAASKNVAKMKVNCPFSFICTTIVHFTDMRRNITLVTTSWTRYTYTVAISWRQVCRAKAALIFISSANIEHKGKNTHLTQFLQFSYDYTFLKSTWYKWNFYFIPFLQMGVLHAYSEFLYTFINTFFYNNFKIRAYMATRNCELVWSHSDIKKLLSVFDRAWLLLMKLFVKYDVSRTRRGVVCQSDIHFFSTEKVWSYTSFLYRIM